MRWLTTIGSVFMVGSLVAACGVSQPGEPSGESVGSVTSAITAACNLNTLGLPCDPDGPGKPKLECEGACTIGANGLVACLPVAANSLNGVICGSTGGVGDAACQRYCSGKTCLAGAAPTGAACRPNNKATPCDGVCDGAGKCENLGNDACPFGREEQLCTFATCKLTDARQCLTALLAKNVLCSDADACSISKCDGKGVCQPGGTVGCDDGNACTDDSCDPQDGGCVGVPDDNNACSDGNACTTGDRCSTGGCIPGTATTDCADSDVCTVDSCDPNTGCAHLPKCADADACTDDVCDGAGACSYPAKVCNDDDPCTTDSCDGASGCVFTALDCDDADSCTSDSCNAGTCVHEPAEGCGEGGAGSVGVAGAGGAEGGGGADGGSVGQGGSSEPVAGGGGGGSSSGTSAGGTGGSTVAGSATAGTEAEAGKTTGGSTSSSAGTAAGGEDQEPDGVSNSSSGCGCRVAGERSSASAFAALALVGLSLVRRRRSR